MIRKILVGFLIGLSILTMSNFSHANNLTNNEIKLTRIEKVDLNRYRLIRPEKRLYAIEEKIDFINGVAPAETKVTIEICGTTDLTRKLFNLLKLPSEEDYIEVFNEVITVGNSGTFSKQLDLVSGINRVKIDFGIEGLEPEKIIIFVNPITREIKRAENLLDMIMKY